MHRSFLALFMLTCFSFAMAKSTYQIDLIIFTPSSAREALLPADLNSPLIPASQNAIRLKPDQSKTPQPYSLLPPSQSSLRNEYYLLHRQHPILGHFSWTQPTTNQNKVLIPFIQHDGWQMQGAFKITQGNYYQVQAELQVAEPSHPQSFFTVSQKQRIKENITYYFDHPHVAMLIKIHKKTHEIL